MVPAEAPRYLHVGWTKPLLVPRVAEREVLGSARNRRGTPRNAAEQARDGAVAAFRGLQGRGTGAERRGTFRGTPCGTGGVGGAEQAGA